MPAPLSAIEHALEPLKPALLPEEAAFYGQYPWCLSAFPTVGETAHFLKAELQKLSTIVGGWQRDEVITNVFLLCCAITDALDDFLAGKNYDFSKLAKVVPAAKAAVVIADKAVTAASVMRLSRLSHLRCWRNEWTETITDFLLEAIVRSERDQHATDTKRDRLAKLLPSEIPAAFRVRRLKLPAFFRSRDFAPEDCFELGRKFVAASSDGKRPIMVMGLRTAGSFLAPLLCAYLRNAGFTADWIAVRPKKGLAAWEHSALTRASSQRARVLMIDESIHSGHTIGIAVELLRASGFSDEDVTILNPAEPAYPDWKKSLTLQCLCKVHVITLTPDERYKQRLLESQVAEDRLREYFKGRGYRRADVLPSTLTNERNVQWQSAPPERVDVRLKRIYEVLLEDAQGNRELRFVLGKSVGCGWLAYHSFIAAQRLAEFTAPVLGLRNGILYTEWIPQRERATWEPELRGEVINQIAMYVAARTKRLNYSSDPTRDLAGDGRHKGIERLASCLSRAYSSRIVAALRRRRIQQQLANQNSPAVMTDSKMSPEEWIVAGSRIFKVDFEHHAQGKNELGMADPAFDLADAIFHHRLSDQESAELVCRYAEQSGDTGAHGRLFLNKLLVGLWNQDLASLGLQNSRLLPRRQEFHSKYIAAWNFLIQETLKECGKLISHAPQAPGWHTPLAVADVDGVLDRMVFGFPCTTASGIRAISLLHAHGFAVALNTARTLDEVKQYCFAYGFAGGVAEYGSVVWDRVTDREIALVSDASRKQLDRMRHALAQMPGIFLNDDYKHSLRAFTYQGDRTAPVPTMLAKDLLAKLGCDRVRIHQTGLDTAIIAKEADKGAGLKAMLQMTEIAAHDVTTFGDTDPDLDMFRISNAAYAPGHIPCRREAMLLGCRVASAPYQPGLLESVRHLVHPDGSTCEKCMAVDTKWTERNSTLFTALLAAADEKPMTLLLRNLFSCSPVSVFKS